MERHPLSEVTCLQMTATKLFLTFDSRCVPGPRKGQTLFYEPESDIDSAEGGPPTGFEDVESVNPGDDYAVEPAHHTSGIWENGLDVNEDAVPSGDETHGACADVDIVTQMDNDMGEVAGDEVYGTSAGVDINYHTDDDMDEVIDDDDLEYEGDGYNSVEEISEADSDDWIARHPDFEPDEPDWGPVVCCLDFSLPAI